MPKNVKTLRVAVAGACASDGRTIEASWLSDIAETYNTKTYGSRCWIEHIRSAFADAAFPAVGDILGAFTKTENVNGEDKLCLYATIKALPQLLEINKKGQKIYSSIEVEPNFAKTGKAYLMGLGFTDSPASIGTEALKFNSHAQAHPTHVFTEACETEIVDSYEHAVSFAQANPDAAPLLDRIAELEATQANFSASAAPAPAATPAATAVSAAAPAPAATPAAVGQHSDSDPAATHFAAFEQMFTEALKPLNKAIETLTEQNKEFTVFKTKIEQTETSSAPQHSGNGSARVAAEY